MVAMLTLAGVLTSGCAVTGPVGSGRDVDFRLRGKIAVRGDAVAFSASFEWLQSAEDYDVALWGPLGQGRVRLHGDGKRLTIIDSRGRTATGRSAEAFAEAALGWSVPITALRYWVRGRYDPASPVAVERSAANGLPSGFEQFGWVVDVSRWRDSATGPVPGRIVVQRGAERILIVCKEWSFD